MKSRAGVIICTLTQWVTCAHLALISIFLKNATNYGPLCWLKLLKFGSWDKLISRKKCKHKNEILHFYPNLFISLTNIIASASNEVKQKEGSGPAAKKPKLDPFQEPGTFGVSSTGKKKKENYTLSWFIMQ